MVGSGVRLRSDEAVPLAHSLVARAAEDLGLRALAIKGPVVAMQGLREPRTSADVDVLVHPDDLPRLVEVMVALGWRDAAVGTNAPVIMPMHSVNLLHDRWPVGIDLHHYFPGFLANAGAVFDALWDRHVLVDLAGVPLPACDPVGQTAVVALHLLRNAPDGDSARLRDLVARARAQLSADDIRALVRLAEDTDATATLRPFLVALGVPGSRLAAARDSEALALWETRVRAEGSAPWILLFARTPLHLWPRTAWRALMLTDHDIYSMHQVVPGEASVTRLRLRRIRRALKGMPRSVRLARSAVSMRR